MKISEFILKLQEIEQEFGDLPAIIDDQDYGASHLVMQSVRIVDSVDYLRPELPYVGLAVCLLKPEK